MKRRFLFFFVLLVPVALFAQTPQSRDVRDLKQLGLTDAQVTQVLDIQRKTEAAVRQDAVQIRLLRAQREKALLPATVDMQAVNGLIDQESAARAHLQKNMVAARVQMRQIMGDDAARTYFRYIRWEHRAGLRARPAVRARWFLTRLFGAPSRGDMEDRDFR
jgi:hypothetical protein